MTAALPLCLLALAAPPTAAELLSRFAAVWQRTTCATYTLAKRERTRDGALVDETISVKLRREPLAVYVAARLPRPGQEIIYDRAIDPDRFVVHPGRFPDLTLRLDLRGALATDRQHHLLTHSGFTYLGELLGRVARAPGTTTAAVGAVERDGRRWWRLHLVAPPPRRARPDAGESVWAFAARTGADPYYLFYLNPGIDDLGDDLAGEPLSVPVGAGARIEVLFDDATGLPTEVTLWDAAGALYEQLSFSALVLDPPLSAADFDPDNPAYGF